MGLIILTIIGAVLGWLGSIVLHRERSNAILACMGAGILGALAGGVLSGSVPLLTGISAIQLLGAMIGAIGAIAAGHFLVGRLGKGAGS